MGEWCFTGKPASPGLAIGRLFRYEPRPATTRRAKGTPADERALLDGALAKAMADLAALATVASGDGAEILAFQIEMLSDPALVEDVLPLIEAGESAVAAWQVGLDRQITDYQTADDDYFRARASDLEDLKNRVGRALLGAELAIPDMPEGALLLADDLTPSNFLALAARGLGGLALIKGSHNSHVAILARGRGLPMLVGLDAAAAADADGCEAGNIEAILDGHAGYLMLAPTEATLKRHRVGLATAKQAAIVAAASRKESAITADGTDIKVLVNVDDPKALDDDTLEAADGVGLLRSEFLLIGREDLPSEDEHFHFYADLQRRIAGKPLIIRTLDIGGDKPLSGLKLPKETNPFLGLRGIRLCLERPDLFKPQVRALLRAAACGPLQVMLPMVTVQAEIDEARHHFADCLRELQTEGIDAAKPDIGIMVETPAAALAADQLDAAFFSIGSNDLIQYAMAASRDGTGRVATLLDPGHVAIERLIKTVVDHGEAMGRPVSLCGDLASEPDWLPMLLRTGVRKFSVAPATLDRVKLGIKAIDLGNVSRPSDRAR